MSPGYIYFEAEAPTNLLLQYCIYSSRFDLIDALWPFVHKIFSSIWPTSVSSNTVEILYFPELSIRAVCV